MIHREPEKEKILKIEPIFGGPYLDLLVYSNRSAPYFELS